MKNFGMLKALALTAAVIVAAPAMAQVMPDIGFKSVGRGWPLAESVYDAKVVGPNWVRERGQRYDPAHPWPLNGYRPNELPKNYKPLPRDVFTSDDFYKDKALWTDPRYFRCNSQQATEYQRGILQPPPLNNSPNDADAPWGHCELGLSREAIVSPYPFKTAQEHYEALLKETQSRGGPNHYTFANFPAAEWNGEYERPARARATQMNWYWGEHTQISTIMSLLTPKYRQYMAQEVYHQMRGHAMWPSTFCWPEGFMRRWYPAAVWEHYIIATPEMVHIQTGVARNFITDIYVDRKFNMDDLKEGGVPRLGAAVPRWYGETIGFWDKDTLITWTSNIQAWMSHSEFEFSYKMQSIEIYTPIRKDGKFVGLNHEAILYDPEALVQPIRIVRNLMKQNDYSDADETPYQFIECVQTIFSVNGINTPLTPGSKLEYEMPDMYGRPWAKVWEENFEKGMSRPSDVNEDLFKFDN